VQGGVSVTKTEELEQFEHLRRTIIDAVANDYYDQEQDSHRVQITPEECKVDAERNVDLLISASRPKDKPELHLCRTCGKQFAECRSNPTFASETDDRVVECDIYERKERMHEAWGIITPGGPMSSLMRLYATRDEVSDKIGDLGFGSIAYVTWTA
jgi:hypothetical protein